MEYTNKGTSIISRKAAEERRRHFFKQKSYWEQLEKRKGNHQYVRSALLDMNELSGEFLIMPRLLEQFFFLYLNKHRPSQQNSQLALSVVRVFALLAINITNRRQFLRWFRLFTFRRVFGING